MKEKLKYKKGITLIALIITIIVMIILVAVSVTVALNGGLFTTAKIATGKTELEKDKELLMAVAVGALGEDGKVVYANIQLPEGFEKESDGTYTKDGYTFIVDEYGSVTIGEGQTGGDEIDFEAIIAAVEANPQEYLARAAALGQDTTSNTDIGIGTNGEIVNLDLWTYSVSNGAISLNGIGSSTAGYKGQIIDGRIERTMPQYIYENNETLTVATLGMFIFTVETNLSEIIIPSSVTSIETGAFYNCTSLTEITIPNSVTSIGNSVFVNCSSLESINIDNTEGSISGSPWGAPNATVTWLR